MFIFFLYLYLYFYFIFIFLLSKIKEEFLSLLRKKHQGLTIIVRKFLLLENKDE